VLAGPFWPGPVRVLRATVKEGVALKTWGVAIGDGESDSYQKLIERPKELDALTALFDGSAWLVKGEALETIRLVLAPPQAPDAPEQPGEVKPGEEAVYPPGSTGNGRTVQETKDDGKAAPGGGGAVTTRRRNDTPRCACGWIASP
jgi:hypothetical protein